MAEKELSQYPSIGKIGNGTQLAVIEDGRNAQAPVAVLESFVGGQIDASGLPSEVDALRAGQQTSAIYAATLPDLQALVGTYLNQGAFVANGAGAGQYRWDGGVWQFLRADMLASKVDYDRFIDELDSSLSGPAQIQAIGPDSVAAGTGISSSTFVYGIAVVASGYIRRIRAYGAPGAQREIKLRIFERVGSNWSSVGSDVPLLVAPGQNDLRINVSVSKGQYVGFYTPAGGIMFLNTEGAPYYNAPGDVKVFTDSTATASIQLQIGFEIQYWPFDAATIANLVGADALVKASFPLADGIVAERPHNGLNFAPTSFTAWSFMFAAGPDFPAGVRLTGVKIKNLNLGAGATALRIRRSTRQLTDAWLNSAPGNAGDALLDTQDFSVGVYALPVGAYRDVELPLPEVVGAADLVVIHELTALDVNGAAMPLGIGRATLAGAQQYQLGFFKTTGGWSLSTTALAASLIGKILTAPSQDSNASLQEPRAHRSGCVGVQGHVGRFEFPFNNSVPKTHRLLQSVPAKFDGVRLILAHASPSAVNVAGASIKAVGSKSGIADADGFTLVTFDGKASVTMPGAEGSKGVSLTVSDLIPLSAVDRTDGGSMPLVLSQAFIDTAGTIALMGRNDGGIDRRSWANRADDPWIARYSDGNCVATPANFTSIDNQSTTCIAGVVFVARGQVISVVALGDSITNGEGLGIEYQGASFLYEGVKQLNGARPAVYSFFNLAWSGSATESFLRRLQAAVKAGLSFDVANLSPWSPNDIPTGAAPGNASVITPAHIATMHLRLGEQLAYCQRYGIRPMLWTGLPTNTAVKDYGSTDALRRSFNDDLRAMAGKGVMVMDLDAALAGAIDADGQAAMKPGVTTDNIHPNDAGIAIAAAYPVRAYPQLALEWPSQLIAPLS